jgi:SAM-dependent methyltransferase
MYVSLSLLQKDLEILQPYLLSSVPIANSEYDVLSTQIETWTPGMIANRDFFNHIAWAEHYIQHENCGRKFRDRYRSALGNWREKIVIDIGCGPGNVFNSLGTLPKTLIGIDISGGALRMARQIGYTPLLADAHNLPLKNCIADIVIANATLHHCDNMAQVLSEAARLVRPGGILITDHDPQATAWQFRGLGFWLHHAKYSPLFPLFRKITGRPLATWNQQIARFHTEIHNQYPGDGITKKLYHQILEPLGFQIQLYPHNHTLGPEVLQGQWGKAPQLIQWAQKLSGLDPNKIESAQSILCIAKRDP